LGLACLFLLLGGIFAMTGGDTMPTSIVITGLNQRGDGEYDLVMNSRNAPLQVNTTPGNLTNTPVWFDIQGAGSASIRIEPMQMKSGETAMVHLNNNPYGVPFFTNPAQAGNIRIYVHCGPHVRVINVRIDLPQTAVNLRVGMDRLNEWGSFQPHPSNEISISNYIEGLYSWPSVERYRLRIELDVFGITNVFTNVGLSWNPTVGLPIMSPQNLFGISIEEAEWSDTEIEIREGGIIFIPDWSRSPDIEARFEIVLRYQGFEFREAITFRTVA